MRSSSNKFERGRSRGSTSDEVLITLRTAQNTGLDVGDRVEFRAYDRSQVDALISNPWTKPTGEQISVRVVGIARDPTDAQLSQTIKLLFGTPAFAREHRRVVGSGVAEGRTQSAPAYQRELAQLRGASAATCPSPPWRPAPTPSRPTRGGPWWSTRDRRAVGGLAGSSRSRRRCGLPAHGRRRGVSRR
jgi:hypothetical protein